MPSSTTKGLVPPTAKDILIGRGHKVYNFIGNRRFRKLIDMFIEEYVQCDARNHKTSLVRQIIDIVLQSGYRFLSLDANGIFVEISYDEMKKKVGHSLRDRTDLVAQHLALKLKTRDELLRDGIPLMDYVERVTPSWHEHEVVVFGLTYPRGSHSNNQDHALQAKIHRPTKKQRTSTGQHSRDIAAASYLLNLSSKSHQSSRRSGAVDYMSRNGEVPTRITEMNSSALLGRAEEVFANAEVAMRMTVQEKDVRTQHETYGAQGIAGHNIGARPTIEGIPNTVGSRKEAIARRPLQKSTRLGSSTQVKTRYFMSLADIVVPTLQNGSELLPIPGNWKFFPSPEFRSKKVDLGTQAKGWSLRLVPQASEEESILLPVPARLIVNGCQKQGQASAADSV